jgi:hypothetical protein
MLSPFAPPEFGQTQKNTALNPDAIRYEGGVKLLSISF